MDAQQGVRTQSASMHQQMTVLQLQNQEAPCTIAAEPLPLPLPPRSPLPCSYTPPPAPLLSPIVFANHQPGCNGLDDIETGHKLQPALNNSSSNDGSPSLGFKLWSAHTSQAQLLDATESAPCHDLSTALEGQHVHSDPHQQNHHPQVQPSRTAAAAGSRWWGSWASSLRPSCSSPGKGQGGGRPKHPTANGFSCMHPAADSSASSRGKARQLPSAPAMVRSRVEPKTFFAAERTFLAWMNIAVLVMFASFSLISNISSFRTELPGASAAAGTKACSGNSMCKASMITGMALAPVAMCLMVYALYMYRARSKHILRREMVRYDDQRGPLLLTLLLIVVVSVSYALQVRSSS